MPTSTQLNGPQNVVTVDEVYRQTNKRARISLNNMENHAQPRPAYDFDVLVAGHLTRLGTKADVQLNYDFYADVLEGIYVERGPFGRTYIYDMQRINPRAWVFSCVSERPFGCFKVKKKHGVR